MVEVITYLDPTAHGDWDTMGAQIKVWNQFNIMVHSILFYTFLTTPEFVLLHLVLHNIA